MARIRVDPLNIKVPIINPKTGTPTPTFMRIWQNLFGNDDDNATTIQDVVKDLRDNVIEAADSTIVITGSGSLLDGPVKLAADVQAILNKLGSSQGAVLYRGATAWSALGPGTSGYVLTTGGPAANPAWAAGAPVTPSLTHNHIFVGNSSGVAADVAMSGDATIADTGALTLANTAVSAGSYGDGSHYATFTVDSKGRLTAAASVTVPAGVSPANPTASVGLTAVNGSATTYMRSDAAPALSQAISPTWSGAHIFSNPIKVPVGSTSAPSISLNGNGGMYWDATNSGVAFSIGSTELGWFAVGGPTFQHVGSNCVLSVNGEATSSVQVTRYSTNANASQVSGRKARGTIALPSTVAQSDIAFQQVGSGYGATGFQVCATIRYVVEEPTPSDTAMGGSIRFLPTTLGTVTGAEVARMLAASQQLLGPVRIGSPVTTAPATSMLLDLVGTTGALGLPTMTTTQKNALTASDRMVVYDSTLGLFQFRQAGAWASLGGGGSWSITDGTHSVSGVTSLTIAGSGVVSGSTPNATLTISGTGYAPGIVPTVVQVAYATSAISATFASAPTNGNWLIAMAFNNNSNAAGTGWTKKIENSTGTDWGDILIKKAGASEPTTQSPMLNATANGGVVIWEIAGANSTNPFVFGATQNEQSDVQNTPILFPNAANFLGLSALSLVTGATITNGWNAGTQDVLDNTGNRHLFAGHTDFSKTPQVGVFAVFSGSGTSKGATCLIAS